MHHSFPPLSWICFNVTTRHPRIAPPPSLRRDASDFTVLVNRHAQPSLFSSPSSVTQSFFLPPTRKFLSATHDGRHVRSLSHAAPNCLWPEAIVLSSPPPLTQWIFFPLSHHRAAAFLSPLASSVDLWICLSPRRSHRLAPPLLCGARSLVARRLTPLFSRTALCSGDEGLRMDLIGQTVN